MLAASQAEPELTPRQNRNSATLGTMQPSDGLVALRLLPVAVERCVDSPVVLLKGPRTVGNSTLLRELATQLSG